MVRSRAGQGLKIFRCRARKSHGQVFGDEILAGICLLVIDKRFVGGDTFDEAIDNFERVLSKIHENNLKLIGHKIPMFLSDTEVFGHHLNDGRILPSDHKVTDQGKIKITNLTMVKQVNSWKGFYKTLAKNLPNIASFMAPFNSVKGGK